MLSLQNFTYSVTWPCGIVASIVTCHPGGRGSNPVSSRKKSFFQIFHSFGGKIQISVRKSTTLNIIIYNGLKLAIHTGKRLQKVSYLENHLQTFRNISLFGIPVRMMMQDLICSLPPIIFFQSSHFRIMKLHRANDGEHIFENLHTSNV